MEYYFDRQTLASLPLLNNREWFMPTGTGGYVSGSVLGSAFRKQHGLLIASRNHPTDRVLLLAKIDEEVIEEAEKYDLSSQAYADGTNMRSACLETFAYPFMPAYSFFAGKVRISKKIAPYHGHDAVGIEYEIKSGDANAEIRFRPLFNFRDHCALNSNGESDFSVAIDEAVLTIKHRDFPDNSLYFKYPEGMIEDAQSPSTAAFCYHLDESYGNDYIESHYAPYVIIVKLKPHETRKLSFVASLDVPVGIDAGMIIDDYRQHLDFISERSGFKDPLARALVVAADAFVAWRGNVNSTTVLAGLPWFTDWGRDTMIAFEGLFLTTRRISEGKAVLNTFAQYERNGLIPNMFPEAAGKPIYNTVDASLWFIQAAYRFYQESQDHPFMESTLFPVMQRIIGAYAEGTDFQIKMDTDGLIKTGGTEDQLTWMDVKIDGFPVTPRHGKPVEINALWYNALAIMSVLAKTYAPSNRVYHDLMQLVKKSFTSKFWNKDKQALFDTIDPHDPAIRPNQIYAVSLMYPLVKGKRAKQIMAIASAELEDVYGIRSLAKSDPRFISDYSGPLKSRDSAYHMGTAWGFLFGSYLEGLLKCDNFNKKSRQNVEEKLNRLETTLYEGCLNGYAEIFDGDQGLDSKGCPTQAWSVAEFIRIYVNYGFLKG